MAVGKNRKLYYIDHCLTPHESIPDAGILCEKERIIAIGGASAFIKEPGLEIIDMTDCFAMPGLIDCHVHGAGGFDTADAWKSGPDDLNRMSINLARHGVTTFFPTLVSDAKERMIQNVAALAKLIEEDYDGADPAGINLEGPFINPEKAGSQNKNHIYDIDLGFAQALMDAGNGRIKLMTFAPELEHSEKLIELMLENGVIPSMGHCLADGEATLRAIEAGARRCTHLFNGMPQLQQRRADLPLIALTNDQVSVELIVDGGHLHPQMVDLASRVKPRDMIIGVSNAIDVSARNAATDVEESNGIVRRDGLIAGTTTTLEKGWVHLTNYAHLPETLAAACFTSNPARDLGLITRGELRPGKKADITFFDCQTNTVRMTVVQGKIVYHSEEF